MKLKLISKWPLLLLSFILCFFNCYAGNEPPDPNAPPKVLCPGARNDCISFNFSTGPMRNQVDAPAGNIGIMSDTPSPTHSTPQALRVVTGLFGIQRVTGADVEIRDNSNNKVVFTFPSGSAVAAPTEQYSTWNASLKMVDTNGNLSVTNAATYDLYTFKGLERVRFCADTNSPNYLLMVDLRTAEGQIYKADEFGLSYIYDEDGSIRQVMAPTRLLDFVVTDPYKYEVKYYEPQDVLLETNGLYDVSGATPFEVWTIENPDAATAYNRLNVSRTVGGTVRTTAFTYNDALHMWSSTEDGGETWEQ
ncbi:MAG: hypothetical protein PHP93_04145, partial [Kiritimatiellales bacterium]|nr:hypothetical protein [Kiritimatiellales bacterium]